MDREDIDLSRLLTITQAADACGIKRANLSHLIKRGNGPRVIAVGNSRFFDPDELRTWHAHYLKAIKRRREPS